jgi:uncharacterized lipoprotein YajG
MRNYVRTLTSVTMVVFVLFFAACSTEDNAGANPAPNPNIAQIIAQDQNFSILNAAVNRAGLSLQHLVLQMLMRFRRLLYGPF